MGSAPPTEYARLEMFCDLVDEYDEIAEAFPVDPNFTIGGKSRPPSDGWGRFVRAMVLRKFMLATSDQVHLSKISAALRSAGDQELLAELADQVDEILTEPFGIVIYGDGEGGFKRADAIMQRVLYGGFLHGDYGKWVETKNRSSLMVQQPLWEFVRASEAQVRGIRNAIQQLMKEGIIEPPA